jgi:hypothetical protein
MRLGQSLELRKDLSCFTGILNLSFIFRRGGRLKVGPPPEFAKAAPERLTCSAQNCFMEAGVLVMSCVQWLGSP